MKPFPGPSGATMVGRGVSLVSMGAALRTLGLTMGLVSGMVMGMGGGQGLAAAGYIPAILAGSCCNLTSENCSCLLLARHPGQEQLGCISEI